MRQLILCANWKMNKTADQAQVYFDDLLAENLPTEQVEAVIAIPDLFVELAINASNDNDLKVGAQNAYPAEEGSFTGETSVKALQSLGVDYVIIGHSERRQLFHETDEFINEKVRAVFDQGMVPILCVGESLEEKEAGQTEAIISTQIEKALDGVKGEDISQLVVGYEPIWAIGSGQTATGEQAQQAARAIRKKIAELYDEESAEQVRIQYGGSVKAENIADFVSQEDIDGGLIGGAGLDPHSFAQMMKVASEYA